MYMKNLNTSPRSNNPKFTYFQNFYLKLSIY